ncbi:ArsR/SmtB family transcription factor [Bifidobacterium aquikefiricola]|uniref:ArsR/SmtB family transcription factor n=1 Tax=Bifidobacterium TaxID=1678 RepID=UPI0034E2F041|nr:metalloregulator ArsR/SmtB family transcription factor [Bifidobacterium tibiigranuli]
MTITLPNPTSRQQSTCCTPTETTIPRPAESRDLARRLKALSDPTRLQLLQLVAAHPGGRACICDLAEPLGVTQPTVSHHMKLLAESGFVTREQQGKWAHYTIRPEALNDIGQRLASLSHPCS